MTPSTLSSPKSSGKSLFFCTPAPLLLAMALAFGCGSSSAAAPAAPASPAGSTGPTSVQVNFGNTLSYPASSPGLLGNPADWMITFTMTVGSVSLSNTNGSSVTVASGSMPMEMRHLMGVEQPVAMAGLPQGTYASAAFEISSASVIYIHPSTKLLLIQNLPGVTKTISLSPPVTLGSKPLTMNFDLDLAQSVTVDAAGNMKFDPVFHVTSGAPGAAGMTMGDEIVGSVAGVSGGSMTIAMMQGLRSLTCNTSSGTHFQNMTGMSLSNLNGMMVEVDAAWQPDGSCIATRVQPLGPGSGGGLMAEGMLFSIAGTPPTQLSILVDNGAGAAMTGSYLGTRPMVNVTGSTIYSYDSDGVTLANLPFTPAFDASRMARGQRIEPKTTGGMIPDHNSILGPKSMDANAVTLEQQAMNGSVANYIGGSPAHFTLNLPAGSAFASLTGATSITVFQQPDTQMRGLTSLSEGANVQVRGLLLFDAGTYKMVATRIVAD